MTGRNTPKVCQRCGASVKPANYSKHMSRVHGINVDKKAKSGGRNVIAAIVLVVSIGVALSYVTTSKNTPATSAPVVSSPSSTSSQTDDNVVRISISEVTAAAKWYSYDSDGVRVRYFLARGSDGKIHLGADACDVCYKNKKGYRQEGAVMTCNNCGRTFAINSLGTQNLSGGCWPSYIPMRIDGDHVVIERSDLDAKQFMFR
ncbi:DUF2318 domain-containing protein [Candidatus Bathyarchaeota archaeon]|nr:DUF2318 domain-containing protein [Candidatus Bathyarchaeota archaeon]